MCPTAWPPTPMPSASAYDELIRDLGDADLQLLGMGHNGHIGFNEPGDAFVAWTPMWWT